jgi:Fe-S oxidoreductase
LQQLIFAAVLAVALGFFYLSIRRSVWMLAQGTSVDADRLKHPLARIESVLVYFFGQKKVAERRQSMHHLWIFWGFLIITIGTGEIVIAGLVPGFSFRFIGAGPYAALSFLTDLFTFLVLVMIGFGFFRRIVLKPALIPMSMDAGIILSLIALLMITEIGYHALPLAVSGPDPSWPLSSQVARMFHGVSPATAASIAGFCLWAHVLIVLGFLNYLPYSKHSHILGSGPNIAFRQLDQPGVLPLLPLADADDIEKVGIVQTYKDFSWKSLLDGYACTECARCSTSCPAWNTEKPLSPMHLIHDVRDDMKERGGLEFEIARLRQRGVANGQIKALEEKVAGLPALVGERVKEDVLWACTTCGACQQECPVFIEHPLKIMQMRQNLVMLQEKVPSDLVRTYTNLERNSNPWGIGRDKRFDWAEGHDVPTLAEKPDAEWLFWVGCAGSYDDRIKKQTLSMVKILKSASVDFAVLGVEEGCTGDPARRSGNEMLYQDLARQNIETLNEHKVRKVVTACPHCLHTIKNEYPQLGGHFEVYHHTQFIRELLETGKLTPVNDVAARNVTYHDSCYLARWNDEVAAPRDVLKRLPIHGGLVELERKGKQGFCCGAGGGRMWMEEKIGSRVNRNRSEEIVATGAAAVAVACPFCNIMVTDGVKDLGADEKMKVQDIAEMVAETLPDIVKARATTAPPQEPTEFMSDSADA